MAPVFFLMGIMSSVLMLDIAHCIEPNFVFLMFDDLGFNDVGWKQSTNTYTPILDNLLQESLELTKFYVYPKCSPTRTSLWTGRYTHNIGMQDDVGLVEFFSCGINPSKNNTFFSEKLKNCKSYNNYYLGKWHMGHYAWKHTPVFRGGYDYFLGYLTSHINYHNFTYDIHIENSTKTYDPVRDFRENTSLLTTAQQPDNYTTTIFGNKAVEIIESISANDDTKFTLMVAFEAPHSPIHDTIEPFKTQSETNGLYGNGSSYTTRKQYNGMIRTMDYEIGRIINALKNNNVNGNPIWDNTYVFVFSDNGAVIAHGSNYPLRGAKGTFWEGGIRVPAMITGGLLPMSKKNTSYDGMIHITDIYPTIMDILDISTSQQSLDGISFKDILNQNVNNPTSRDSIIVNANSFDCQTRYNQSKVCGVIIKDFGPDGIYKLLVGNQEEIMGVTKKYRWTHLENQANLSTSTLDCDPHNLGLTQPTWNIAFVNKDCSQKNRPCLFKLSSDPCEYNDLSTNATYNTIKNQLISELRTAYDTQLTPFEDRTECNQKRPEEVFDYWTQPNMGYVQPFEAHFNITGTALSKANTPIYTDTTTCTPAPTEAPSLHTIAPTFHTTAPTGAPTLHTTAPTETPTTPTGTPTTQTAAPTTQTGAPTTQTGSPTTQTSAPTKSIVSGYVSTTKTWSNAEDDCVDSNTHLLSVTNEMDKNTVAAYLSDIGKTEAWIGLKKTAGTYKWIDGTNCTTDNIGCVPNAWWQGNQAQSCVTLTKLGKFKAERCSQMTPYFCGSVAGTLAVQINANPINKNKPNPMNDKEPNPPQQPSLPRNDMLQLLQLLQSPVVIGITGLVGLMLTLFIAFMLYEWYNGETGKRSFGKRKGYSVVKHIQSDCDEENQLI